MIRKNLRLLYVGDVPVEASYHGSALVFRLLQDYHPSELRIVESNLYASQPERRLPGIAYATLNQPLARLLHTRFAKACSCWLTASAPRRAPSIEALLNGFQPQAVLSVSFGYSWIAAAHFAASRGLPFHLICHDDWPGLTRFPGPLKGYPDAVFGAVYRQATSRLCVSPFMRDDYRARYGATGTVLYPSRSADCKSAEPAVFRARNSGAGLTVAFGGSLSSEAYPRALRALARSLETVGGRLLIFGPGSRDEIRGFGLERPNVEYRGLLKSAELMEAFRAEADVLFVPMSFQAGDRANMEVSFPSKLTDYTAVGLPLLIQGPEYSSAVRWARENPGVAMIVNSEEPGALTQAVEELSQEDATRRALGLRAREVGDAYFSYAQVSGVFHSALRSGEAPALC